MITRKVGVVLLILMFTAFGSSQSTDCSKMKSEAKDYLLDGEHLSQVYTLQIKNKPDRCVFPVKNSKVKNSIIIISKDSGDYLNSKSDLRNTYHFYYTKKRVERDTKEITNQFKEAEQKLNSIEADLPPKLSFNAIVDSAFIRYCPVSIGKLRFCAKDGINFIAKKSCGFLNPQKSCIDWGNTISQIEELRTNVRDLGKANTFSKKDIKEFYSQGIAVKEFMLRTDKEVEADLSNIITISFQDIKSRNQNKVEKQVRERQTRIKQVRKELKNKRNKTIQSLVKVESRLKRLNNDGYKVKEKYSTYCGLRENASKNSMRNKIRTEEFKEFERELKLIQNHPLQNLKKTELEKDKGLLSGVDNFFTSMMWDVKGCGWLKPY